MSSETKFSRIDVLKELAELKMRVSHIQEEVMITNQLLCALMRALAREYDIDLTMLRELCLMEVDA